MVIKSVNIFLSMRSLQQNFDIVIGNFLRKQLSIVYGSGFGRPFEALGEICYEPEIY
jgi:hypothetical protein